MSTAFEKSKTLHHSLGRPSRSDFVHFQASGESESTHEFEFYDEICEDSYDRN